MNIIFKNIKLFKRSSKIGNNNNFVYFLDYILKNPSEAIKTHNKYKNSPKILDLGNKQLIGHTESSILLINDNYKDYFILGLDLKEFIENKKGFITLLINPEYSEDIIKLEFNNKSEIFELINVIHTLRTEEVEGFIKGALSLAIDDYMTEKGGVN